MSGKAFLIKPRGLNDQPISILTEDMPESEFFDKRAWEIVPGSGVGNLPTYYRSQYGEVYAKYGDSPILVPLGNQKMGNYPAVHMTLNPLVANLDSLVTVHSLVGYRSDFPVRKCLLTYSNRLEKWVFNTKPRLDHKNRDVFDSSWNNLEWVTAKENERRKKNPPSLERRKRNSLLDGEIQMKDVDTAYRYNY